MYASITLTEMGKADDIKPRRTREFDSARLAALTEAQVAEAAAHLAAQVAGSREEEVQQFAADLDDISFARTATIDDPMTTGLLAEVARRSQTAEFDDELIKEAVNKIDAGETTHPHTRRRSR
jgi:hypothetical protein